jgi:maltooligosyltrehalose synthase
VLAPRLTMRIGFPPLSDLWRDTTVHLPAEPQQLTDLMTDEVVSTAGGILLARAFARLPFAALTTQG